MNHILKLDKTLTDIDFNNVTSEESLLIINTLITSHYNNLTHLGTRDIHKIVGSNVNFKKLVQFERQRYSRYNSFFRNS